MRRRDDVLWRAGDGFLAMARIDGTVRTVTGPGVDVWRLLATERTRDELVAALAAVYAADPAVIRTDLTPVLDELVAAGFLDG